MLSYRKCKPIVKGIRDPFTPGKPVDKTGSELLLHGVVFQKKKCVGKLRMRAFQRIFSFEKRPRGAKVMNPSCRRVVRVVSEFNSIQNPIQFNSKPNSIQFNSDQPQNLIQFNSTQFNSKSHTLKKRRTPRNRYSRAQPKLRRWSF